MAERPFPDQVLRVLKPKARVPIRNGEVVLREHNVMDVVLAEVPAGVMIINMRRIGSLSGIREGAWKKACDYLLIRRSKGGAEAVFVELKKNLTDPRGKEQLRRSLPYLDYIRSLCRIEYGAMSSPKRVLARYVLIGKRTTPGLAKQGVTAGPVFSSEPYEGITIQRYVGSRIRFAWLDGA